MAKEKQRVSVDIADLIEQIDQYPEAMGIDPVMWSELTYPQKCKYLMRKQLEIAQQKIDEMT